MKFLNNKRAFSSLNEAEILGLAISSEEDDARIFQAYAQMLRKDYPGSATVFEAMANEELSHRDQLISLFQQRFGQRIPLIRREHIRGYRNRKADWLSEQLSPSRIRHQAELMEQEAYHFYLKAAAHCEDVNTRRLLGNLAQAEQAHISLAQRLMQQHISASVFTEEKEVEHRQFILTFIQPGLAGLMDGSVSTLAPIFAAAFATGDTWQTFLVGLAASIGAGISMGFTEVASDDGVISGRGSPMIRGLITGIMTTVGGLGHALPYLITDFWTATALAMFIVVVELFSIAWIQNHYMQTSWARALTQIVIGGFLVLAAGLLIGQA